MKTCAIQASKLVVRTLACVAPLILCCAVRGGEATTVAPPMAYYPRPSADARRVADALDREISLDFKQLPLGKVAASLQHQLGVTVAMADQALEDAGLTAKTPITFQLSNVRARTALDLMLGPLDLQVLEDEGFLLITTQDKAEEVRFARVYPVGDLLSDELVVDWGGRRPNAGPQAAKILREPIVLSTADYDGLIDLISITVRPQTWDSHPEIVELPSAKCLVVLQTREVHDEIAKLLQALRDAKQASEAMAGE